MRSKDEAGLTLVELLLSMGALSMIAVVVTQALSGLTATQSSQRSKMHMAEVSDRMIRMIEQDANSAIKVFTAGAESSAYLEALDLTDSPVLAGSSLPLLTDHSYFDVDPVGTVETGNMILLGRNKDALLLRCESLAAPSSRMRFDTFALVLYHLTKAADGQLDLARWESVPMASYVDLASIEDPDLKDEVLQKLYALGMRFALDPTQSANQGIFEIGDSGSLNALAPGKRIPPQPRLCQKAMFNPRWIQVASNGTHRNIAVPAYAQPVDNPSFPAGFEVKVDGRVTGKLMMLRMVLTSSPVARQKTVKELTSVINCRGG
ncbi:MAG: PulJ/GspJ family protein [Planctomycetota bacterium]|jgi:type II secretory pathway pseudopilin PulG